MVQSVYFLMYMKYICTLFRVIILNSVSLMKRVCVYVGGWVGGWVGVDVCGCVSVMIDASENANLRYQCVYICTL